MAPRPAIDPAFVKATVRLAGEGLTDAEIVRRLQRLTPRIGKAAPSYHAVRRIAGASRRIRHSQEAFRREVLTQLLLGRAPRLYEIEAYVRWLEAREHGG